MKEIEVECEFLKRSCENLTDENGRLQKEVQELSVEGGPCCIEYPLKTHVTIHREAEEKRAFIEAKKGEDFLKVEEIFAKYRATGTDILKPHFLWDNVFEPFPYKERYSRFLKICLSSPNHYALVEWVDWVKSRFRGLLLHGEFMKIIKNGYEGSPGRIEMFILLASQLPN
ncbi:hypothetical protein V8G54_027896 [Vigna mungo]|uniref:Leucine zipper homeobox-associated domain-containing protein n=1 Tax=Vigna mungo TaxID=3915 RepID=A0AAQ3MRM3_VIGMU